jgi:hypothetical protein
MHVPLVAIPTKIIRYLLRELKSGTLPDVPGMCIPPLSPDFSSIHFLQTKLLARDCEQRRRNHFAEPDANTISSEILGKPGAQQTCG